MECFAAFLVPVLLLVGSLVVANGVRSGRFRLADGAGLSSLNYVGFPAMYHNLPPQLGWITDVYTALEPQRDRSWPLIGWWVALPHVLNARKAQGLPVRDRDAAAMDTTLRVIRARPFTYGRIWLVTLKRYWYKYELVFGPWETSQDWVAHKKPQVGPLRWRASRVLTRVWRRAQPVVSLLCLVSLPLGLLFRERGGGQILAVGWLWTFVVSASLLNTAIEPALGQPRYRLPWSALILALSAFSGMLLIRIGLDRSLPAKSTALEASPR